MRVLVISQQFSPEMGALPNRLYPLTRHLAEHGHEVFVATGMPNYPRGEVFPDYRGRHFMRERRDGAIVLRTGFAPRLDHERIAPYRLDFAGFVRTGPVIAVRETSQ